jgi:hypothetical protein
MEVSYNTSTLVYFSAIKATQPYDELIFSVNNTVILSFLERERDRDFVNVSDRVLVQYD